MAQEQLQIARELLKQKRYDEARALLKTIDHPKAREWLQTLDTIAPESSAKPTALVVPNDIPAKGNSRAAAVRRETNSGIITVMVLLTLIVVALGVLFYSNLLRSSDDGQKQSVSAASTIHADMGSGFGKIDSSLGQINSVLTTLAAPTNTPTITPTLTPTPSPTNTPRPTKTPSPTDTPEPTETPEPPNPPAPITVKQDTAWSYLTLQYSQVKMLDSEDMLEAGFTSDPTYDYLFAAANDCLLSFGKNGCARRTFRGLSYYMNELGKDKWQLISVVDKSTQNSFRVEMIFMRPNEE